MIAATVYRRKVKPTGGTMPIAPLTTMKFAAQAP